MKKILYIILSLILLFIIVAFSVFFTYAPRIPRLPDDLRVLASSPATEIYSRDGELMATIGGRSYVPLSRISPHFQNAIIAAEDKRFYSHNGVDLIATARSLWINATRAGRGPGGSSITQQLAKNMFFTFKRSWERKIVEGLAALAIEQKYSKDQVLEAYCNLIAFGPYAFGIENASRAFFNKSAINLELNEAALLAGLPNGPSRYNPFRNFDAAKDRQKLILNRMTSAGMITQAQADSTANVPLILSPGRVSRRYESYAVDYAIELASNQIDRDIIRYGGVRISTNLDPQLQRYAEDALSKGLDALEPRLKPLPDGVDTRLEGAMVAIEVATGQVLAVVGGRNYRQSQFNRALYAPRHPGSSFKPVVYLTALEKGVVTPATVLVDAPYTIQIDKRKTWTTRNYSRGYRGPISVKYGLMKSINTISAQLIDKVKPAAVVETAKRLGLPRELKPYYTLSLGAQNCTPIEMANIYSSIAREGVVVEPQYLRRIESRGRDVLFESFAAREAHFDPATVYILIDMLKDVMDNGTGKIVRRKGFRPPAFGKTGTSSESHDSWFCGATTELALAVWVGYDDNRSMRYKNGIGITGADGAAPIWADFMIKATAGQPTHSFPRPDGLTTLFMEPISGKVSKLPEAENWVTLTVSAADADSLLINQLYSPLVDSLEIAPMDSMFHRPPTPSPFDDDVEEG